MTENDGLPLRAPVTTVTISCRHHVLHKSVLQYSVPGRLTFSGAPLQRAKVMELRTSMTGLTCELEKHHVITLHSFCDVIAEVDRHRARPTNHCNESDCHRDQPDEKGKGDSHGKPPLLRVTVWMDVMATSAVLTD